MFFYYKVKNEISIQSWKLIIFHVSLEVFIEIFAIINHFTFKSLAIYETRLINNYSNSPLKKLFLLN
jgi:hypothetical protein